jgi:hypothetical protein
MFGQALVLVELFGGEYLGAFREFLRVASRSDSGAAVFVLARRGRPGPVDTLGRFIVWIT